jgi:hypothetical protein
MRLVTRADLDGLTCAVLLSACEQIDAVELVQPQDVADRRVPVGPQDILANLPYHPACGMWFDNHLLTDARSMPPVGFKGRYAQAPSAARVVYDYYANDHGDLARYETLLAETDRLDSAQLTLEDVLNPAGYVLLGFTLDTRTGLGGLREYFDLLLPAVKERPLDAVLALPEVRRRVDHLRAQDRAFREAALSSSRQDANVVLTDFRPLDPLPVGNRFLIFTLFPEANVAVRVQWGPGREKVSVSAGRSIFNRTCKVNLGVLMSLHGGGGQPGAGACLLEPDVAESRIADIVSTLKRQG